MLPPPAVFPPRESITLLEFQLAGQWAAECLSIPSDASFLLPERAGARIHCTSLLAEREVRREEEGSNEANAMSVLCSLRSNVRVQYALDVLYVCSCARIYCTNTCTNTRILCVYCVGARKSRPTRGTTLRCATLALALAHKAPLSLRM